MNRTRTASFLCFVLCSFQSLVCHAATNYVLSTSGDGAVLTAPWTCGWTDLRTFTVTAWINPAATTAAADRVVVERADKLIHAVGLPQTNVLDFRLGIDGQGHPFASYNGAEPSFSLVRTPAGSETVASGQWTHLAARYDGSYLQVLRNGRTVCSMLSTVFPCNGWLGPPPPWGGLEPHDPCVIAMGAGTGDPTGATTNLNSFFSGRIDEVAVWNGALSDAEIRTWMYAKPDGTESNLVGYWSFDGGSASDATTNAIDGWFCNSSSQPERIMFPANLLISVAPNVAIGFQTVQDSLYAVEFSTDLTASNWVCVATNIPGTGIDQVVADTNATSAVGFYRVLSL